jgi:hypothetical protein
MAGRGLDFVSSPATATTTADASKPCYRYAVQRAVAASAEAADARSRKDANGDPEMIRNICGEVCGSVTMLEPGDNASASSAHLFSEGAVRLIEPAWAILER